MTCRSSWVGDLEGGTVHQAGGWSRRLHGGMRSRRSRRARPAVEDLEVRSLLTTLVALSPAAALAWTSLDAIQGRGSFGLSGDVYSGSSLAESNDDGATSADVYADLNYDGNNMFDEKEITFYTNAFCGFHYSEASVKEVTSGSGSFSDTSGSYIPIQIQPLTWAGEQNGDPVRITLTGSYSVINGMAPPNGGLNSYQISYNPTGSSDDYHDILKGQDTRPGLNAPQKNTVSFDTTIGSTFYVAMSAYSYAKVDQGSEANWLSSQVDLTMQVTKLPKNDGGGGGGGGGSGGGGGGGSTGARPRRVTPSRSRPTRPSRSSRRGS